MEAETPSGQEDKVEGKLSGQSHLLPHLLCGEGRGGEGQVGQNHAALCTVRSKLARKSRSQKPSLQDYQNTRKAKSEWLCFLRTTLRRESKTGRMAGANSEVRGLWTLASHVAKGFLCCPVPSVDRDTSKNPLISNVPLWSRIVMPALLLHWIIVKNYWDYIQICHKPLWSIRNGARHCQQADTGGQESKGKIPSCTSEFERAEVLI